jgi:putative phosphoribosyl transferase
MERFRDREDAGRKLADILRSQIRAEDQPLVLALPRGGVPVGAALARSIGAPLDVWVVRKVGVPWQPELEVGGAVAEGGYVYLNATFLRHTHLTETEIAPLVDGKRREIEERKHLFRGDQSPPELRDRTVIVVDEGMATGSTVLAAIRSIRVHQPRQIIVAVPVAGPDAMSSIRNEADRIVCLLCPDDLYAIGTWYRDFAQVSDEAVLRILERARAPREPISAPRPRLHEGVLRGPLLAQQPANQTRRTV